MDKAELMFGAPSRYAAPGARYRDIDVSARVEGASPHGLVQILFDELQKGLETLRAAEASGDFARRNAAQARVTSILHGLEASLDYQKGGEIAANLGKIYREGRRLIATVGPARAEALAEARTMLGEIAAAWTAIA
ncbi:flagellar export chaperone FliS [Sphingomonas sp.]|uniref:flagellar export chaperone FliS n=1 Tax=Sphingomonas sp. TaxID=28214 RepID=UPI003B3A1045